MSGGKFDTEFSSFLRALKQRSDIVEIIRSYVAVDRKGGLSVPSRKDTVFLRE